MKNVGNKLIVPFAAFMLLMLVGSVNAQQGRTIAGVTFDAKLKVKDQYLNFNGAGLREKYSLDLYAAALYLGRSSMDASSIINDNKMQAIKIVIISKKVTRDKFNESVKEGFEKASEGKATKAEIDKFKSFFSAEFKEDDEINIIYVPGKGTAVTINGDYKGIVPGLEFKKALFSIWLGAKPASSKLKSGMLGKV
jgi:hypothetical protein